MPFVSRIPQTKEVVGKSGNARRGRLQVMNVHLFGAGLYVRFYVED